MEQIEKLKAEFEELNKQLQQLAENKQPVKYEIIKKMAILSYAIGFIGGENKKNEPSMGWIDPEVELTAKIVNKD